ncbi:unnamed protein product [Prunus brigantina]
MEIQLGQIADSLNQREPGKFPSQTNVNPKHHEQAKAITVLRSGKVFDNKVGNEVTNDDIVNAGDEQNEKTTPKEAIPIGTSTISPQMHKAKNPYLPPIPFPRLDKLILPADFVVLDMEDAPIHNRELPILLGRPFMATANTLIDVKNGILKMTVLGRTVEFKVFESLSHPSNSVDCFSIDCLDSLVFSKFVRGTIDDDLEIVLTQPLGDLDDEPEFMEVAAALEVSKPYHSSISPIIEPLEPASIKLVPSIEDKLIKVPRDHKNAIGWTIADIKGISPTMCMHRILMEDAKPTREPQRRLNPPMKDVVRTEILKLLDVGVIYPISDSKWVSPIQVVPKKLVFGKACHLPMELEHEHIGQLRSSILISRKLGMSKVADQ